MLNLFTRNVQEKEMTLIAHGPIRIFEAAGYRMRSETKAGRPFCLHKASPSSTSFHKDALMKLVPFLEQ